MTAPEPWWSASDGHAFLPSTTDDHGFSELRRYRWVPELPADAVRLASVETITGDLLWEARSAWMRLSLNERDRWIYHDAPQYAFMADYLRTALAAGVPDNTTEET